MKEHADPVSVAGDGDMLVLESDNIYPNCAVNATAGGEVALAEGIRQEASRRRRQWHHRLVAQLINMENYDSVLPWKKEKKNISRFTFVMSMYS